MQNKPDKSDFAGDFGINVSRNDELDQEMIVQERVMKLQGLLDHFQINFDSVLQKIRIKNATFTPMAKKSKKFDLGLGEKQQSIGSQGIFNL